MVSFRGFIYYSFAFTTECVVNIKHVVGHSFEISENDKYFYMMRYKWLCFICSYENSYLSHRDAHRG
jgi:hypothetical protein